VIDCIFTMMERIATFKNAHTLSRRAKRGNLSTPMMRRGLLHLYEVRNDGVADMYDLLNT